MAAKDSKEVHCYMQSSKTGSDHFSSINLGYRSSSTVRTTCSCSIDRPTCSTRLTTVFSVSMWCAGACIMVRYPTEVCSGLTVLAVWLKEVQEGIGSWEDRVIVNAMSVAWAFVAEGQQWTAYLHSCTKLISNKI